MNTLQPPSVDNERAAERFALRVTARLTAGAHDLPYDISERLRASRVQALSQRKREAVRLAPAAAGPVLANGGGTASLGRRSEPSGWWSALISAVPLTALVVGLVVINVAQDENSVNDFVEVDSALLTDDLPPAAYSDPGFVQFLKTSTHAN